ncbi:MAG: T9SS type A sorting domain-containing protein [Ignavibacteria bacterium]|nr:T9SS type A sorting domain-containing protein [Ignavibacteria bacterium]
MKSKLLIYFFPMFVVAFLIYGYSTTDDRNTATSLSESTPNWVRLPDQNPNYTDLIGAWTSGAAIIPSARYYAGGVGYTRNDTGWVFVWGGDSAGGGNVTNVASRYNVTTNTWALIAPLPGPIRICASARLQNNVYSIGGTDNLTGTAVSTVYKYDINTNTWTTAASLPTPQYFIKAVGYQDSIIYTAGGYNGTATTNAVSLYNSSTNSWRNCTPLPDASAEGAFSRSGDTLVYIGGLNSTVAVTANVYRGVISQTDRSVITWTSGAPYPVGPKYRFNAYEWGNKGVIVPGGAAAGFTGTNTNYIYSPGADAWTVQANKPTVICAYQGGSVRLANGIWKCIVAGGVGNGALTAANEIFTDTLAAPPPPSGGTITINRSRYKVIPENGGNANPALDTITVSGIPAGNFIRKITVTVDTVLHSWIGDLRFWLTQGSSVDTIISRVGWTGTGFGNSCNDFIGTKLVDSVGPINIQNIPTACIGTQAQTTGTFNPKAPLNVFNNIDPNGLYVLRICDNAAGDTGSLRAWSIKIEYGPTIGISGNTNLVNDYKLSQNYPNPFNPSTKIDFSIPKSGLVTIKVYDIIGKEVATLVNEIRNAGNHEVTFNGSNLSSGVYFYRIESANFIDTKKMFLLK